MLIEVDPSMRDTRRASRVNLDVDVLWTAEEEAERNAEEEASSRAAEEQLLREQDAEAVAREKIERLGITQADLRALLGI